MVCVKAPLVGQRGFLRLGPAHHGLGGLVFQFGQQHRSFLAPVLAACDMGGSDCGLYGSDRAADGGGGDRGAQLAQLSGVHAVGAGSSVEVHW